MNPFRRAQVAVQNAAEAASTSTLDLKTTSYRWVPCVMIGAKRGPAPWRKFLGRRRVVTGHRLELITLPGSRPKGKAAVKAYKRARVRQSEKFKQRAEIRRWMRNLPRWKGAVA